MTPARLAEIEARCGDTRDKWNIVFAQNDREALLEEVKRLQTPRQEQQLPVAKREEAAAK